MTAPRTAGTGARRWRPALPPARFAIGLALLCLPLVVALLGPLLAGEPGPRGAAFVPGGGHPFGTDFAGQDVLRQVLLGGRSVVLIALAATVLAYAVALPLAFAAALTHRAWLEELLMRPLDVLLAVPSLLMVLLVATVFSPGPAGLAVLVALVNVPDAARLVRATAAEAAARPAVEALRMQGESWWRIAVGYVARSTVRTLAADAGVRMTGVLYLVATAAFLGVGVDPDAADWAVMVDRNRTGLFVQPWAVVVPALLIVALSMGANLLSDAGLARGTGRVRRRPGRRTAPPAVHERIEGPPPAARPGAGAAGAVDGTRKEAGR